MLVFLRQEMVGDTKKGFDGDMQADFFAGFADCAILKRLQIIELAADDAPATRLGGKFAKSQKRAAMAVKDEDTNADLGAENRSRAGGLAASWFWLEKAPASEGGRYRRKARV